LSGTEKSIMSKSDLIIFDCDGVLVDSEVLSCGCLSDVLAEHGIELGVEQALELFAGRNVAAVREHYRGLGRRLPDEFSVELAARVRAAFSSSLSPIQGVGSVLERLRVPSCVASSSDAERVSLSLALTGLAGYFGERVYTSQMVKHGKPAPDLFLHAAACMRADPRRTLVVEDSVSGVTAGKAAGMTVWGFVGGRHYAARDGRAILQAAGADRVFARMSDFWPQGSDLDGA
jgi:HAD superfamily hydrolase (TIGR01509 family)